MPDEVILGIDPGSRITGYGIVSCKGNQLHFVNAGIIRPHTKLVFSERLERIYSGLREVIARHNPTISAVEGVFHSVNARAALLLGHARGAVILASVHGGLPVFEYSPMTVKQAVVGYGRAEKTQVQHMIRLLLNLSQNPAQDAADALAVAICHAHSARRLLITEPAESKV